MKAPILTPRVYRTLQLKYDSLNRISSQLGVYLKRTGSCLAAPLKCWYAVIVLFVQCMVDPCVNVPIGTHSNLVCYIVLAFVTLYQFDSNQAPHAMHLEHFPRHYHNDFDCCLESLSFLDHHTQCFD